GRGRCGTRVRRGRGRARRGRAAGPVLVGGGPPPVRQRGQRPHGRQHRAGHGPDDGHALAAVPGADTGPGRAGPPGATDQRRHTGGRVRGGGGGCCPGGGGGGGGAGGEGAGGCGRGV